MKPVKLIIAGAGQRGWEYAKFATEYPGRLRIIGVAEPRDFYRKRMAETHSIPTDNIFTDWKEMVSRAKFADAVLIATQDSDHAGPAVAFADLGYHVLLEKPMAPNPDDCRKITDAAIRNGNIFAVCHVLRYTRYTKKLKEILSSGMIGDIVSIQHLEPVGYWHQAHSFVRGNWRNEKESSFMLLAKSCHDIDYIHYLMGEKCTSVSSFGSLKHFRKDQKPEGAGDRCVDCGIEPDCPYSAKKVYLQQAIKGYFGWPLDVLTPDLTVVGIRKAIEEGPYGKCVYECDNDVVDNQVVNMQFESGSTAVFTMVAFTEFSRRKTRIFGTRGEICGDGINIEVYFFLTDKKSTHDTDAGLYGVLQGHGGGDYGIMDAFLSAVSENDPSKILSGPEETLESHLMVFAAEKARLTGSVTGLSLRQGDKFQFNY